MTISVWRFSHLALAIISFIFILMASITGAILSFDPINEKSHPYKVENFEKITLEKVIPILKDKYNEILEISIDHNGFVTIDAYDNEGNDIKKIINPSNGEILGEPLQKSEFIQWVTSLHRSLFLKETGRFIVGIVSFLLLLITISGTVLIIKRQQGLQHFFAKITKDFFAQYYHTIAGRLLLIPIFILALTGTYLFLLRFGWIQNPEIDTSNTNIKTIETETKNIEDFSIFKSIYLKDIQKIEFPFDSEDPEEFYKIKTQKSEIIVNQFSGTIEKETLYPSTKILESISLDLHTGRTNIIWAVLLGIASINILFFIWSGFVITFKRTRTKITKNKYQSHEAKIIVLVGSENGTTLFFANKIHQQLLSEGKISHLAQMNQYKNYPNASHLLIFTSTYGIGEAPTNAKKFESLIKKIPQNQNIKFAVVGFGSRAYSEFCGYAIKIHNLLENQFQKKSILPLKLINDKSPEEFANWTDIFNSILNTKISTNSEDYVINTPKLSKMKVIENTQTTNNELPFITTLTTNKNFQSGDLLAIYPANDYRERLYSIGKVKNKIQLVVKLHQHGLGSQFLHQLKKNETIKAKIIKNTHFHFPKKAYKVFFIANGTGIAPFLGMIDENQQKTPIKLLAGFRYKNHIITHYEKIFNQALKQNKLSEYQLAFSREENPKYVTHLVQEHGKDIIQSLEKGAVIMICGSLAMQNDVENILNNLCLTHLNKSFDFFKNKNQFLTDCY